MAKTTSQRTFTACWTCRSRNIRCDTRLPFCTQCARSKLECEGYDLRLVWVDSKTGQYEPQHRRTYPCELTWSGYPSWTIKEVGHLIIHAEQKRCRCRLHDLPSPFGLLDSGDAEVPPTPHEVDSEGSDAEVFDGPAQTDALDVDDFAYGDLNAPIAATEHILVADLDLSLVLSASSWSPSTPWVPAGSREDNELFHHYVSALAPVMTPIDNDHNPWKSTYPRLAVQAQDSPAASALFHAILAQSAFQRANLNHYASTKYLRGGIKNYVLALRHLRHSLNSPSDNFTTNLAAMLTVTIAGHCFQGQSAGLGHHLEGAVRYVAQHLAQKPWADSHDTWVVTQSFVLHTLISQTTRVARSRFAITGPAHSDDTTKTFNDTLDEVLGDVTTNPSFAYTVGSTPRLMKALHQARQLELQLATESDSQRDGTLGTTDDNDFQPRNGTCGPRRLSLAQFKQASAILAELDAPLDDDIELYLSRQRKWWQQHPLTEQQWRHAIATNLQLFRSGIGIYLCRMVLRYPPSAVAQQVASTLQTATELLQPLDRAASVSIWPIFIAAVEAYEPEAQELADLALQASSVLGAVNRATAHHIVKCVWARRQEIATRDGCPVGEVLLDWRDVLKELDVDILLL